MYFFNIGIIEIENLKRFRSNYIKDLSIPYLATTNKIRKLVASKISNTSTDTVEYVVETHTPSLSLWGEYISKQIKAKHISYFLSENFAPLTIKNFAFFKFKLEQNLLYGISDKSISGLFGYELKSVTLNAVGCSTNIVEEIDLKEFSSLQRRDYNILSLGRLDKPYIFNMIKSIKMFAIDNIDKEINLFIVGDSSNSTITKKVLEQFESCKNIHCLFFGYLYPIPRKIFTLSDVCIASAGSVRVASKENVPTIVIDANDYEAIGVFGYTTDNTLFRSDEVPTSIVKLLHNVLVDKIYSLKENIIVTSSEKNVLHLDFSHHQNIMNQYFNGDYFNLDLLQLTFKDKIKRAIVILNKNAFLNLKQKISKFNIFA
ncbi:MAG TPA: hypothetical protein GX708_12345 [Gallicola sp.]|nr:hypothetical protein [Gallicola sp.]